ncbi:hypothetical protein HR060_17525 [Catenovulum sp. SM1970]|uniref:hypothetical protein n=1 Tax=Marinifaba aquimaris TaxID=2741323 RepID=UPI0015724EA8|nr:hypothetical protein [Marinifaba aquimaris]NTS78647.1 hypothetical protein [Marinifaba aquimaris]
MLSWTYNANLLLHILAGTIALLVLAVPYLTRKGNKNHRKFGSIFIKAMMTVGWTGIAMALMIIFVPENTFFPNGLPSDINADAWAKENVNQGLFLLSIAAIVLVAVRYSVKVLAAGQDRVGLKSPRYLLELAMPGITGLMVLNIGLQTGEALYIAFAFIGLFLSLGYIKFVMKSEVLVNEHIIEHFSAISGASIAAVTAFAVTGAERLLDIDSFTGQWRMVFWLGPSVIGTMLVTFGHHKFRRQFGVKKRATAKQVLA